MFNLFLLSHIFITSSGDATRSWFYLPPQFMIFEIETHLAYIISKLIRPKLCSNTKSNIGLILTGSLKKAKIWGVVEVVIQISN